MTAFSASAVVVAVVTIGILAGLGGWEYYTTPLAVRAQLPAHRLLRPSGAVGHLIGIAGALMMLAPVGYSLRKKWPRLRAVGSMQTWLDVHVFCGIVGPVLVTFHTSFKFNGVISVAYWLMVAVMLSGFVGRYLYIRIPHGLRGAELTRSEIDARAESLHREIEQAGLPESMLTRIHDFEYAIVPHGHAPTMAGLWWSEVTSARALARLRRDITHTQLAPELLHRVADLIAERASLLRRVAYLDKTRRLFHLWHVFHMPLVYLMFAIVSAHIALTLYLGYVPFDY